VLLEFSEHVNVSSAVATVGVDKNDNFLYAGLFIVLVLLIYFVMFSFHCL